MTVRIDEHTIKENEMHGKDKPCIRCGRTYPDTILNINGYIHHPISGPIHSKMQCFDDKDCRRHQRKMKRRAKLKEAKKDELFI